MAGLGGSGAPEEKGGKINGGGVGTAQQRAVGEVVLVDGAGKLVVVSQVHLPRLYLPRKGLPRRGTHLLISS